MGSDQSHLKAQFGFPNNNEQNAAKARPFRSKHDAYMAREHFISQNMMNQNMTNMNICPQLCDAFKCNRFFTRITT